METIYLNFTDFGSSFNKENNFLTNVLRLRFNVVITDKPEFLIYSVFGTDYLNYDCIRIFYTGENLTPNFNSCDYALGFDWLTFGDRYFRLPYYYFRENSKCFKICLENKQFQPEDLKQKDAFCNFIYSNGKAHQIRTDFFHRLSEYKFVHSGGKQLNNIGQPIANKFDYQQKFKFSIAFENSSSSGYTTEKIVEAKAAGTIPIYWGNPDINREMNSKAYIDCHDFADFDRVIDRIIELDNNDEAYLEVLNQPLFKKKIYLIENEQILDFFQNIFESKKRYREGFFRELQEQKLKQYRKWELLKQTKLIQTLVKKLARK